MSQKSFSGPQSYATGLSKTQSVRNETSSSYGFSTGDEIRLAMVKRTETSDTHTNISPERIPCSSSSSGRIAIRSESLFRETLSGERSTKC